MKPRAYLFLGLGLGLIFTLVVGWTVFLPYQFQGSKIESAGPAADFSLVDQSGGTYKLSEQKDKVVLLFFGYTHCTDVCPVTLVNFTQIRAALGEQASNVEFVFVTVDPDRDSPEILKKYIDSFDPTFIGLTGSKPALEDVWKKYGIYRAQDEPSSSGDYLVEHTARVYLVDQKGNLLLTYPFGFEAEKITQDLLHLIKKIS